VNRDPIKPCQAILDSVNLTGAKRDVSASGHNPIHARRKSGFNCRKKASKR
jgi:hypothetical protein